MSEIEIVPLARLRPAPWNPRTITKERFENLKRALQADPQMLRLRPILAMADGTIYGGNYRYRAAEALGGPWLAEQFGAEGVPTVIEDITPEQARERALRDNGQWGDWEEQQLAEMLYTMKADGVEVATLGFPEKEISRLLDSVSGTHIGGGEDEDEIEIPVEPATRPGDLIELGRHRLICGDGTDRAVLSRLLGGDHKVSMAFTDPPWNVGIGEDENPRHKQRPGLKNDSLSDTDYAAFLKAAAEALAATVAGDIYVVMGGERFSELDAALRGAGLHWSGTIVWAKDIFVLGRSNYHRQYEPIWYGWPKKARSTFQGARDLSDLWSIPRPKRSDEHPSMKPIELVERAVKNSSERGDTVLDIFGGSGTTLLACERNERACRMAEIDPGFCDVVVTRWERHTGGKAVRPDGAAAAATPTSEPTGSAVRPKRR